MTGHFANPLIYWNGFDINNPDPAQRDVFQRFYLDTHVPEVLAANPGFVAGHLYQRLDDVSQAQGPTPSMLAIYEMDGEAAAAMYIDRNDGPPEGRPKYTPGPPVWKDMSPVWRMVWRQLEESSPAGEPPTVITVIGAASPTTAGSTDRRSEARSTSWELVRELRHPAPGSPPFLVVDEGADSDNAGAQWSLEYGPVY